MNTLLFVNTLNPGGGQGKSLLFNLVIAVLLAFFISVLSLKFKFLTLSGTAAMALLAVIIFGFGTWKWTIPMFSFFFFSSLLSKIREKKSRIATAYFEKNSERDWMQVFANGGFAGLLVLINYFYPSELFYYTYVSSIAAVCADTWATETGTLTRNSTYNILSFKRIPQGESGGVSVAGFAGSAAGAVLVAISSLVWIGEQPLVYILLILISGLCGSIIDSILGASLQAQYKCANCGKTTELAVHCGTNAQKVRGIKKMNNDIINLISGISGGVTGFILSVLIYR